MWFDDAAKVNLTVDLEIKAIQGVQNAQGYFLGKPTPLDVAQFA